MPPLRRRNTLRLCDRPTDRPTDGSMNHLPSASHKNTRPTRTGWVFCSLRSTQGRAPSLPSSLPPNRWGRVPPSLEPWRERGKGRGKKQSLRERSERSPFAPQAPEAPENSEKRIRSQEVEKSESWKVGKSKSRLENPGMRTLTSP